MVSNTSMAISSFKCHTGWEYSQKHIFILSSSGKPIFSRYGDEHELINTFSLLQAIQSIVISSGDSIGCIGARERRILFVERTSLYFVSISSTEEPDIIIYRQLDFMYNQLLLILTSKFHDIMLKNSSTDLMQLMGSDSSQLLQSSCHDTITVPSVAFGAIESFPCPKETRNMINFHLQYCVEKSGAA